jgi:hypothetical protein
VERLAAVQRDLSQVQSELRKALVDLAGHEAREKASDTTAVSEWALEKLFRKEPGSTSR